MNIEDRKAKARKLADLTGSGNSLGHSTNTDESYKTVLRTSLEERSKEFYIELRAKHMTEEQLDALLEFYESDIGMSILESSKNISEEFQSSFHERMSSPPLKEGEASRIMRTTDPENGEWVTLDKIRKRQSRNGAMDIPKCSLCKEIPDHIGKIVAGCEDIFLCRDCISNACDVLKETGFPVNK